MMTRPAAWMWTFACAAVVACSGGSSSGSSSSSSGGGSQTSSRQAASSLELSSSSAGVAPSSTAPSSSFDRTAVHGVMCNGAACGAGQICIKDLDGSCATSGNPCTSGDVCMDISAECIQLDAACCDHMCRDVSSGMCGFSSQASGGYFFCQQA